MVRTGRQNLNFRPDVCQEKWRVWNMNKLALVILIALTASGLSFAVAADEDAANDSINATGLNNTLENATLNATLENATLNATLENATLNATLDSGTNSSESDPFASAKNRQPKRK